MKNFILTLIVLFTTINSHSAILTTYEFGPEYNGATFSQPGIIANPLVFNHIGSTYDDGTLLSRAWNRGESIYRYFEFNIGSQPNATFDVSSFNFDARKINPEEFPYVNGHNNIAIQYFNNGLQIGAQTVAVNDAWSHYSIPLTFFNMEDFTVRFTAVPGFSDWYIEFDNMSVSGNVEIVQQAPAPVPELSQVGLLTFCIAAVGYLILGRKSEVNII